MRRQFAAPLPLFGPASVYIGKPNSLQEAGRWSYYSLFARMAFFAAGTAVAAILRRHILASSNALLSLLMIHISVITVSSQSCESSMIDCL